jgi:CheY-like chemotaxis protein
MAIKNILVVDDSATERHITGGILTKGGYTVTFAEDGETGVAKAKSDLPDLIVMDVVMPGLNGFQATRAISTDDATKDNLHHQGSGNRQDMGFAPRCQRLCHQAGGCCRVVEQNSSA